MSGVARGSKTISNASKSFYQNVVPKPVPRSSQRQYVELANKTYNLEQADTQSPKNLPSLKNIDPSRVLPSTVSSFYPRPLPNRPATKGQTTPRPLAHPSDHLCKYEDVYKRPRKSAYDGNQVVPLSRNDDSESSIDRIRFMYEEPRFEFDLLLIGKTGQGKSALGNSILWRKAFESKPSSRSVTKTVSDEQVEYKGKVINVVDGPGVGDTDFNAKSMIVESLSEAMTINLRGYHAFLLVVKFGERYTRESCIAIEVLKSVFGENFVKKFCIVVMTFGDLFEGGSFRDWLSKETGDMIDLVKECDKRVILYDSKTKDKRKRDRQLDALLDMVQTLALKNGRYTSEQFDLANLSRGALIVEPKKLLREEGIMKEANLILTSLQSLMIKTEYMEDPNIYKILEVLQLRTTLLLDRLQDEDYNTLVSQDLINSIQSLEMSINDEITTLHRFSERMKTEDSDRKAALNDSIRKKRTEFYLSHMEGDEGVKTVNKSTSQTNLEQSSQSDYEDICIMEEQWKNTKQLKLDLNEIKKKEKKNVLDELQKKILFVLTRNLKDDRKTVN